MKLNKKGFGVAEIAIVILLIGILAAAVIVGFLGIKKNATEHVKEEATKSLEMIHQTKHAYPTILSGDTKSIRIKSGEYEVYEMGGYDILAGGDGIYPMYIEKDGTLYITGNGTLEGESTIDGTKRGDYRTLVNGGTLIASDLRIIGGDTTNKVYPLLCKAYSTTELNNVVVSGGCSTIQVNEYATLTINGVNSKTIFRAGGKSGRNIFWIKGTVVINNGETIMGRTHSNSYFWVNGGSLTINDGTYKDGDGFASNAASYYVFYLSDAFADEASTQDSINVIEQPAELIINGGIFDCRVCNCSTNNSFIYFDGDATVTITGGEFKKEPAKFVIGAVKGENSTKKLIITGGTFHFDPQMGNSNGWGEYVAPGYKAFPVGSHWEVHEETWTPTVTN